MAIILDELKLKLKNASTLMESIGKQLDLEAMATEMDFLRKEQEDPALFSDKKKSMAVGKRLRVLEQMHGRYNTLSARVSEAISMCEMVEEMDDQSLANELFATCDKLLTEIDGYNVDTLLSGDYDDSDAILTLHAGAGGTEAQDWTQMLYRMYTMFCEKHGFKFKILDCLDGDEAGYKSVTFEVTGDHAYGYLKAEAGVHRLVRISPFDSNARRHTSFSALEVAPVIEEDETVEIRAEDLKVDTFRSSGAGGQHVNKTESAIRITHIPSGIVVACQNERSQIQNREKAMTMLKSKLVERREREREERDSSIKGEIKRIEWGSQIRSYVFAPYTMVKDHRTNFENTDVYAVMDGNVMPFIHEYLRKSK